MNLLPKRAYPPQALIARPGAGDTGRDDAEAYFLEFVFVPDAAPSFTILKPGEGCGDELLQLDSETA